jgi:alkaline phosphatase
MIRIWIAVIAFSFFSTSKAQTLNSSRIFAHNDYARPIPFYTAYELQVGFIEADVFLIEDEVLIAHHKHEIQKGKTLEALYLEPLLKAVQTNRGSVYKDPLVNLTLMIDLKTDGVSTLKAVVNDLEKYKVLTSCPSLHFMISGNVPDPNKWFEFPPYITFDGRPGIRYTSEQLKRISMISTNFRDHASWNGQGQIPDEELKKIRKLMEEVHTKGKQIRFWATPDFENAWKELMRVNMDVIVTDDVVALDQFLKQQK